MDGNVPAEEMNPGVEMPRERGSELTHAQEAIEGQGEGCPV